MSTQSILIENGRVVDPSQQLDKTANLLIANGKIVGIGVAADDIPDGVQRVDAIDKIVTPGLVDMHVHLRQPGYEEAETVATAPARHYTAVSRLSLVLEHRSANRLPGSCGAHLRVSGKRSSMQRFPICCISKGREAKNLQNLEFCLKAALSLAATTGVRLKTLN